MNQIFPEHSIKEKRREGKVLRVLPSFSPENRSCLSIRMKEESEEGIGRLYDNFYPKGEDTEETEETKECWEGTCITSMNARS